MRYTLRKHPNSKMRRYVNATATATSNTVTDIGKGGTLNKKNYKNGYGYNFTNLERQVYQNENKMHKYYTQKRLSGISHQVGF